MDVRTDSNLDSKRWALFLESLLSGDELQMLNDTEK